MLGLAFCGCHEARREPAATPPSVGYMTLQPQYVPLDRNYVARTDAFYTVDVKPRVSGELVSYNFVDGQSVQKGRLLFQLVFFVDPTAVTTRSPPESTI